MTQQQLILIDSTSDSLTVSWPETKGASRYILEYRTADDEAFSLLSDKLSASQAKKRNLQSNTKYYFRAKAVNSDDWISHDEPFVVAGDDARRMEAPTVTVGGNHMALVSWKPQTGIKVYELQMREAIGGASWATVAASLVGTEVRKKNLTEPCQFRVRSVNGATFSPASPVFVPLGLSDGMKRIFRNLEQNTLRKQDRTVPLEDALGGKEFVLLYASAHWCGPCRQFTPMLVQWYQSLGASRNTEVVFLSADHNERDFNNYYQTMPWLSVDFDDDTREELMAWIRVTGIPRLAVLDGRTGRIVEDNAVGKPLDIQRWRALANK